MFTAAMRLGYNWKVANYDTAQSPRWEEEQLFTDGDSYYESILGAIAAARLSIELEVYIFADDTIAGKIVDGLLEAHRRGVKIRVLVDGVGTPRWPHRQGTRLVDAGIPSKVYHPIFWKAFSTKVPGIYSAARWISGLNRRDHRKVIIVDGQQAWLGSMNISDDHARSQRGEKAWRDTALRVRGADVRYLSAAFEKIWLWRVPHQRTRRKEFKKILNQSRGSAVRLNATYRLRRYHNNNLLRRIRRAERRIWICTPYFVPTVSLLRGLRAAAKRGLDVRVLMPGASDVFFMAWVASAFERTLARSRIQVYRYTPSILHAKTMLLDDWAMVGSSNINHRSIVHDLEVDAVLTQASNREELARQFDATIAASVEFRDTSVLRGKFLQAFIGRLILAFKRWL